jgi:hypothetical protein
MKIMYARHFDQPLSGYSLFTATTKLAKAPFPVKVEELRLLRLAIDPDLIRRIAIVSGSRELNSAVC